MKRLLLASTSTMHAQNYLEYILPEVKGLFANCKEVVFIPYARPGGISHEEYTNQVKNAFQPLSISVKGIHEFKNSTEAIATCDGIFTGGGNTFLLVNKLYQENIIKILQEKINQGTPYLGTSAGTNIAGLTMQTTNDMPIIYPPSFKTLALVPFNINAHFLDPDLNSTHKGETRETRIKEFHTINTQPVIGLREGSWIEVKNEQIHLRGKLSARIFKAGKEPFEMEANSSLSNLK